MARSIIPMATMILLFFRLFLPGRAQVIKVVNPAAVLEPEEVSVLHGSLEVIESTKFALDNTIVRNSPLIITVGDSITAFGYRQDGWVSRLGASLGPAYTLVHGGMPMGNSFKGVEYAKYITRHTTKADASRIKLLTLCFGANDASTRQTNQTYRSVYPGQSKANLKEALDIWRSAGVKNFLLITPPPASHTRKDRRWEVTAEYAQKVLEVGAELHVPVADLFTRITAIPNWPADALVKDGLHLNSLGQSVMYDEVLRVIKQNYEI